MSKEGKKKKLSGWQNLLNKRKREEDLEKCNLKITQFMKKPKNLQESSDSSSLPSTSKLPPASTELSKAEESTFDLSQLPSTSSELVEESQDSVHKEGTAFDEDNTQELLQKDKYSPLSDDPGLWPSPLSPNQVQEIVQKGPVYYQNASKIHNYPKDKNGRKFSDSYFTRVLPNNEKVKREWLIYSVKKNTVFCFCCKIFNDLSPLKNTKLSSQDGFNDWIHLSEHLKVHEISKLHFQNLRIWSDFLERLKTNQTVDSEMQDLLKRETKHWRDVIERIIYTVQFLAEQNLALRGSNNKLFEKNNGNFLKCIEIIAKFDPVMSVHINRTQMQGQKHMPHYLGDKIQNETINLLGNNIRNNILSDVKRAKYFSILLDCTPDVSHQEQISVCVRYVNFKNSEAIVEERFLTFCPIIDKTGEGLSVFLLKTFDNYGLNIHNLRGQGYDNGSNMKAKRSGLQKRILLINRRAFFVPCCNHSLNLVVNDAAKSNTFSVIFFSIVQEMYNFFSASTNRWAVLKRYVSTLTLKPLSETRWSSRIDAISPLRFQLGETYDALYEIASSDSFDNTAKHLASSLAKKIKNFEFICMLVLWYKILNKVNIVSNILQSKNFNISQAIESLSKLNCFLKDYRSDDGFNNILVDAKELSSSLDVDAKFRSQDTLRPRKIKKQFSYESEDSLIENEELKFKVNCFFETLDIAISSVNERFEILSSHSDVFKFLWNIADFNKYSEQEQFNLCNKLEEALTDNNRQEKDINSTELLNELQFLQNSFKNEASLIETLNYITTNNLTHSFPNVTIALRILLTIPVSVATPERSFSKLKLIKNYLRSNMGQERLENLAIISIESDLLQQLDIERFINEFASNKARKVRLV